MTQLKRLSREAIPAAVAKAEHYRLLNQPRAAESICLDILDVDPRHQKALVLLLLARTDQFARDSGGASDASAREVLPRLDGEYERAYYAGIVCERWAKALLLRGHPGSGEQVHAGLHEAMGWFEKAEKLRPAGNDDAILRYNACARLIDSHHHVRPAHEDDFRPLLE